MSTPTINTLDQARQRIAALEATLSGKAPLATIQPTIDHCAALDKASKLTATPKLVTSTLATIQTLATVQSVLNDITDVKARIAVLSKAADQYRAQIQAVTDQVEKTKLMRSLNKLETCRAYEMLNDKGGAAWKNRYHVKEDLIS